jgi:hypothetical protein
MGEWRSGYVPVFSSSSVNDPRPPSGAYFCFPLLRLLPPLLRLNLPRFGGHLG